MLDGSIGLESEPGKGSKFRVTLPHVLGHEVVGEIAAVGKNASGFQKGDLGVVYSYVTCHNCELCLSGRENLCIHLERVGFEREGGFTEYLTVPAYNFCPFSIPIYPLIFHSSLRAKRGNLQIMQPVFWRLLRHLVPRNDGIS